MTIEEIEQGIRQTYNLSKRVKLRNIKIEEQTFEIKIGNQITEVIFPQAIRRQIKIEKLLGE